MAPSHHEQRKPATFFIRISSNPIVREEFCVSDSGVHFFDKVKQSGEKVNRLKALCHDVLSIGASKKDQNPEAKEVSVALPDSSSQKPRNVGELIKFLQSQKSEAEWTLDILSRQVRNLETIVVPQSSKPDPLHILSLNRTRRNMTEISNRAGRLQQAIKLLLLCNTDQHPDSRLNKLVADVIKFLRCQAADMTFGAEEAQNRIQELSRTVHVENFPGPDPFTRAMERKSEFEFLAQKYHQVADALSQIGADRLAVVSSSPLTFWRR